MKLKTSQTPPMKVSLPNGSQQTVRQEFTTYYISTHEDMEELQDKMLEGVEILTQIHAGNGTYVTIRKVKPVKIAL